MTELPPDPHAEQIYTLRSVDPNDGTADEVEIDAGQALDLSSTVRDEPYSVDDNGNVIRRWSAITPREAA